MKRIRPIYIIIIILLCINPYNTIAQNAATILKKMDYITIAPKDKEGKVSIILIDKTGNQKVREAQLFQKGPQKKLYRYTKPESQAGIATLTLSDSVMWLYLPALGKPKRISMLSKDFAFNNTDFSFEDMATTPYAERFVPEIIETAQNYYVLRLNPKPGKSNYSKIIARVNKTNGYVESMDIYDLKGKKIKEAVYKYEKVGNYWNAYDVTMKDLEKNHSTRIIISEVKFDQGLSDSLFLIENMKSAGTKKPG